MDDLDGDDDYQVGCETCIGFTFSCSLPSPLSNIIISCLLAQRPCRNDVFVGNFRILRVQDYPWAQNTLYLSMWRKRHNGEAYQLRVMYRLIWMTRR